MLEPTSMMASSPRHNPSSTRKAYPPEVFDRMTDILADLVLEDLKRYPQLHSSPCIDRFGEQGNTSRPNRKVKRDRCDLRP
jgi:hypothetical protein